MKGDMMGEVGNLVYLILHQFMVGGHMVRAVWDEKEVGCEDS